MWEYVGVVCVVVCVVVVINMCGGGGSSQGDVAILTNWGKRLYHGVCV